MEPERLNRDDDLRHAAAYSTTSELHECTYCTSRYNSPSAMMACEQRCATDRGRE